MMLKEGQLVEITLVCVPIQIFMFMRIAVILSKIFNVLFIILTLYNDNTCIEVNTFKHEYLCNQLADWNEILSKASLGWKKGFSRF